jgi:glutamate carboxypeptidase
MQTSTALTATLESFFDKPLMTKEDWSFLQELVNTNSQSRNIAGVNQVQQMFAQRLNAIGLTSNFIQNTASQSGDLLVSHLPGRSPVTLTTIGHADTVLFPTDEHQFKMIEGGSKIIGPGIADNKSGILIAMKGIEYFSRYCQDRKINVQFVSSPNEEIGSPGFHQLFNQMGEHSQYVLGFEPALEDGSLIHSRNGNRWYRLEVEGKTAHSGRAHKGHMNAAHDLCKKIQHLTEEVLKHADITMNVGAIEGGSSYNVICEKIIAKIDTRFSTFSGLDTIQEIFEGCLNHLKYPCKETQNISTTSISVDDHCPPLENSFQSKLYLDLYRQIISDIEGEQVHSVHCGGAADVNHFSNKFSIAFDGLGPVAANMHRRDEYVLTSSIETRARAFGEFLLKLNESIEA